MKKASKLIVASAQYLDILSGIMMVIIMLIVVLNVLARSILNSPLFGTFEYVGFLTALVISFAIANCGVKNGHIAIDLFISKLPRKVQPVIDFTLGMISTFFLGLFTWQMIKYGTNLIRSGELSATTRTPLYIFVFLVAFGLLLLTAVVLLKTIKFLFTQNTDNT